MEDIFGTCQLCGNPLKDKQSPCTFCTGDHRTLFGVEWGWMYQREFDSFQRKAYFLGIPTAMLTLPIALSQYTKRKKKASKQEVPNPVPWISIWGAQGSGKTWLMYALLNTISPGKGLAFFIKEGKLTSDDVTFQSDTENNFLVEKLFPIEATQNNAEKNFFLLKKQYIEKKYRGQIRPDVKPGPNSHIHQVALYDSPGGWHEKGRKENSFGDQADEARKRISQSPYIIILLNKDHTQDVIAGLADLIKRMENCHLPRKIAICLNKVEQTKTFLKYMDDLPKLQQKEIFTECLQQVIKNESKRTGLINKFEQIEALQFAEVRYFCLSSCGCDDNGIPNLNVSGNEPAKTGTDWEPINVFSIFAWFLGEIERARIDCDEDIFAKFEKIPISLEKMLDKWHLDFANTKKHRLKEYIPYSDSRRK